MTKTFIALLRGVNVGGANSLPTKGFVVILESLGLQNVKTYIQSGNAVFQGDRIAAGLAEKISSKVRRNHGHSPTVIVLRLQELERAVKSNPFPRAESDPKALHLVFLASTPKAADLSGLNTVRQEGEQYSLKGRVFYFWAPHGVGRSKLFSRIEKTLGVRCTARNWRTVGKLLELARGVESEA